MGQVSGHLTEKTVASDAEGRVDGNEQAELRIGVENKGEEEEEEEEEEEVPEAEKVLQEVALS